MYEFVDVKCLLHYNLWSEWACGLGFGDKGDEVSGMILLWWFLILWMMVGCLIWLQGGGAQVLLCTVCDAKKL